MCTGNVCRSPYIERRLRQLLGPHGIQVTSAGTSALVGMPIDPGSAARLGRVGADIADFAARPLTADLIAGADLVLVADRDHRAAVVRMHAKALRSCFTLGDFADLVRHADLSSAAPGMPWVAHVAAVAASCRGRVPPRDRSDSDIVDPYRRPDRVFDAMAAQVERDLESVVRALTPPSPLRP